MRSILLLEIRTVVLHVLYALRYSAGCLRALKKKLKKSKDKKKDLLNCLGNMLNSDDTVQCDSNDWIDCVDRGGLTLEHLTYAYQKMMI